MDKIFKGHSLHKCPLKIHKILLRHNIKANIINSDMNVTTIPTRSQRPFINKAGIIQCRGS